MIKEGDQNDWFSITIHEGRNRQVRRMCEAVSLSVVRLRRVRYGSLEMGTLKPGEFRYLSEAEVNSLRNPHQKQLSTSAVRKPVSAERRPQRPAVKSPSSQDTTYGKKSTVPHKNRAPRKP
jgi:hypothetical protein